MKRHVFKVKPYNLNIARASDQNQIAVVCIVLHFFVLA